MSELQNERLTPADVRYPAPHLLPPDTANQETPDISRRSFLSTVGKLTVGAMIAGPLLSSIDRLVTHELYPPTELEINLVPGAEKLARGGREWLVNGGWGQQNVDNAGLELFDALNGDEVVATMTYPNQEFNDSTVAEGLQHFFAQRNLAKLGLVGVSAGTPIVLMGYKALQIQQNRLADLGPNPAVIDMPKLDVTAMLSSPASLADAFRGDLAETIAHLGDKLHYTPEMTGKLLYSLFDGQGDTHATIDVANPKAWMAHLYDSLHETFNDCSPQMVWSQLVNFMQYFDFAAQSTDYRQIMPGDLSALYLEPSDVDPIVNDQMASDHYHTGFNRLGISDFRRLSSGNSGHANTIAAAKVIAREVNQLPA